MKPVFLEFSLPLIGQVSFTGYAVMLTLAFVVSILGAQREGMRTGMDGTALIDLGLLMVLLGLLGARILAVLTDGQFTDFVHLCTDPKQVRALDALVAHCTSDAQCGFDYLCDPVRKVCHPPRDCLAVLKFWQGGLTFYGGLIAASAGGLWFARRRHLGVWRTADLAAPFIMLGLAIGRLGCFFNGCCYGAPTDSWLGMVMPGRGGPVHPIQLYESAAALALFFLLYLVARPRKRGHGEVFGWMLVGYGLARIALELLRADPRGALGPLSTSQLVSVPLIPAGVWLIVRLRRGARVTSAP
jgi:phosphatidylglycerol:prolipoprotein diacylglycerol transferase